MRTAFPDTVLTATERKRIVPVKEAARLRGCHVDTILKERDKLVEISPKRLGMRLEDALMLTD
jgi:hypothetical protein